MPAILNCIVSAMITLPRLLLLLICLIASPVIAQPSLEITSEQRADLANAVMSQIRPCYRVPDGLKVATKSVITTFDVKFKRDGTLAGFSDVIERQGVDSTNKDQAEQIEYLARRAMVFCQPIKLPQDQYEFWSHMIITFRPEK